MNVPSSMRLSRYLTVIVRWLLIAFAVFILTILSGFYITDYILPKVYTATAQIQIRINGIQGIGNDGTDKSIDPTALQAELTIMRSSEVLLPVIKDLGLDKTWAKRVFKPKQDQLSDQDALAYMNKVLKLDVARGTNIINITVSSDVPIEAARIANAVANRYKTMRDAEEETRNNALRDRIAQQQKVVDEQKAVVGKLPQDQSPVFRDAQIQLEEQKSLLDALIVRLQQIIANSQVQESPVRIISRAEPPAMPSKPNRRLDYLATILVAGFLSVTVASFVEMMLLISRASERTDN